MKTFTKMKQALLLACFLLSGWSFAQKYIQMMHDPNSNFFDVTKEAEKYFDEHGRGKGSGYKQYTRWAHEMSYHIDSKGNRIVLERESSTPKRQSRTSNANGWTQIGPINEINIGGISGASVSTCFASPINNPNKLYAGIVNGGVWISNDGGTTWITTTDHLPELYVRSIAISPSNENVVYFSAKEDFGQNYLYRSTNGGTTWTEIEMAHQVTGTVEDILINPSNVNEIYLASSDGIFKSTNSGDSFSLIQAGNFNDIAFKPTNSSTIYACGNKIGFWISTNSGSSFSQITSLSSSGEQNRIMVSDANPNYVYYMVTNTEGGLGYIYKSVNSGQSFTTVLTGNGTNNYLAYSPNSTSSRTDWTIAATLSSTNANELYIGGNYIFKSTDGGITFSPTGNEYHVDIHHLDYIGNRLYASTDGGIYLSTNNGQTWTFLMASCNIRQCERIAISPFYSSEVSIGAYHMGTSYYDGTTWKNFIGGDGMETFFDINNADKIFGTGQNGGMNHFTKSTSFNKDISSLRPEQSSWITPLFQSPKNSNVLYYGGLTHFYKSTDYGQTWNVVRKNTNGMVTRFAISPSNPNYIYLIEHYGIWGEQHIINYTKDGGLTWSSYTLSDNPNFIEVHPTNPERLVITTNTQIFETKNCFATTPTNITKGLSDIFYCARYQKSSFNGLYIGSRKGVYYIDDQLTSWVDYTANIPNAVVRDIEIQYLTNELIVGTFGRGVWKTTLYKSEQLDAPKPYFVKPNLNIAINSNIIIEAKVVDIVDKIEFYEGNTKIGEDATAPYTISVSKSTIGEYEITAKSVVSGKNSVNSYAYLNIIDLPLTNAQTLSNVTAQLDYKYYENPWSDQVIPDYSTRTPIKTGKVGNFDISPKNVDDHFGFQYTGYIKVETDGIYTFTISSDDGSRLYLNNQLLINNDGLRGMGESTPVSVGLKAGYHAIKVDYFEYNGGEGLNVFYEGPNVSKQIIPASVLFTGQATQTGSCSSPQYVAGTTYATGTTVQNGGKKYECTVGGWCSSTSAWAYEPGVGTYWQQAWTEKGDCASGPVAPTISIVTPASNAILGDSKGYNFSVNTADADGSVVEVKYEFTGPNSFNASQTSVTSPFNITYGFTTVGTYQVKAIAKDNQGNTSFDTRSFTVVNGTPTISIASPANNAIVTKGQAFTISVNVNDLDGTIQKVKYIIYGGGSPYVNTDVTTAPFSFSFTPTVAENLHIQAIVFDNDNRYSEQIITVSVVEPVPPTILITSPANNGTVNKGQAFNIFVNAADADGTIQKVKYIIAGGGSPYVNTDVTTAPFSFSFTPTVAENLYIEAIAFDNQNNTTSTTITVQVINVVPPTISITSPTASSLIVNSKGFNFTVNAADADGSITEVKYEFTGTGYAETRTITTTPFSIEWGFVNAGNYQVKATAKDNQGNTASATQSFTVVNGSPSLTILTPANNATLTKNYPTNFTVNTSDVDGTIAKVEYYFKAGGIPTIYTVNTAPFSLTYTPTFIGAVTVDVIATDNEGRATTKTINLTFAEPIAPTLSITSPANNATVNKGQAFNILVNATDADGTIQKVKYIIAGGGSPYVNTDVTASPFSFSYTPTKAENLYIEAIAFDNQGNTTSKTITVVVVDAPTCTAPAWVSGNSYSGGAIVEYQGIKYKANWWTQTNPSTNNGPSGSGQPWTSLGACTSRIAYEVPFEQYLSIAPNPVTNNATIFVNLPENDKVEISVIGQLGQKVGEVFNGNLEAGNYEFNLNGNSLPNGMYILVLKGEKGTINVSFVKQ